jgi:hypothetical protein
LTANYSLNAPVVLQRINTTIVPSLLRTNSQAYQIALQVTNAFHSNTLEVDGFNQQNCYSDYGTYVPRNPNPMNVTNAQTIAVEIDRAFNGVTNIYRWAPFIKAPGVTRAGM